MSEIDAEIAALAAIAEQMEELNNRVHETSMNRRITLEQKAAFSSACAVQAAAINTNAIIAATRVIAAQLDAIGALVSTNLPTAADTAIAEERAATVTWLTAYRDLAPGISGLIDDIRLGIHRIDPNEPPREEVTN